MHRPCRHHFIIVNNSLYHVYSFFPHFLAIFTSVTILGNVHRPCNQYFTLPGLFHVESMEWGVDSMEWWMDSMEWWMDSIVLVDGFHGMVDGFHTFPHGFHTSFRWIPYGLSPWNYDSTPIQYQFQGGVHMDSTWNQLLIS